MLTNLVIKSNLPVVDDKYKAFLPKTCISQYCEFVLNDVSNAISRGLARTLSCEMLVPALSCEVSDIKTTDGTIIPELIVQRIRSIPIKYDVDVTSKFTLRANNNTAAVKEVFTAAITGERQQAPFNGNMILLELQPGKNISINNIEVYRSYGYKKGDGMHTFAVNVASVAVDVEPKDPYDKNSTGESTMTANPRVWKISFNTNGQCPPDKLIALACDNLIDRLKNTATRVSNISTNGNKHIWTIPGETMTIGNLLTRTVSDLHPEMPFIVPNVPQEVRMLTMKMICDSRVDSIMLEAIDYCVQIFMRIKTEVSAA